MRPAIALALVLTSLATQAAELRSWEVAVKLRYGQALDYSEPVLGVLEASPGIEIEFSPHMSLVLSGRIRLDMEDRLEPGESPVDTYSPLSRPYRIGDAGTAEMRDAYLQVGLDNGLIRIGKQQIVWGRLDGLKVLDTVNPQHFREFILEDFDESRISLWSIYLDKSIGDWRTELAFIPDTTGHATPSRDSWFELTAPRFRYGSLPGSPQPASVMDRNADALSDGAWGIRVSRTIGPFEASAVAYSGLDFEPLGRSTTRGEEVVLDRYYERRDVFGISAETAFGPLALRAEISRQPGRVFNLRSPDTLDATALDQTTVAAGVDFDGPLDVFLNLQYVLDRVENAPATLVRPARDRIVTAFMRRTFMYDTLALEIRWYRSLEDRDNMLATSLSYQLGENTRLKLGAESFNGARHGLFGQFAQRDRAVVSLEHTF